MNLEDELRKALGREDPSPGFAQRVAAHARSSPQRKQWFSATLWAAAVAAMVVMGVAITSEYREKKAERAGREVVIALRIAAEKLNMARDKVARQEN